MDQIQRIDRLPQADLAKRAPVGRQRAIGGNRNAAGIGGDKDRGSAIVEQAVTVGGHQFPLSTGGKTARAGQALTLRGFDQKKPVTLNGQIKGAAGLGQRPLGQVNPAGVGGGHRQ